MKLKKIASLALAGVMAVSMLAGCSTGNSNSNSDTNDDVVVVPTSAVVDIFNKGQDVTGNVQVKFTADSGFEKNVVAAVEEIGTSNIATSSGTTLLTNLKNLTGFSKGTATINTAKLTDVGFLDDTVTAANAAQHKGEVNSFVGVSVVGGSATVMSAEAAAKSALTNVQTFIDNLKDGTKTTQNPTPGDDYLTYAYTGNVCVVAANTTAGAPIYVVAYVINQNVTLETAPEV